MSLDDAWADVRRDSVFTIHTPVSAGNERFDADLVRRVAGPLLEAGGVPVDDVLELGLGVDGDRDQFDMTAFSLRLTHGANAVSQLHAETANATWQGVIDHPILGITNGIHGPTWIGAADRASCSSDLGADLDDLDAETAAAAASGSASTGSRRATCGRPTCARSASSPTSPAAGCAASSPATARRRRSWPSSRRRSIRTS